MRWDIAGLFYWLFWPAGLKREGRPVYLKVSNKPHEGEISLLWEKGVAEGRGGTWGGKEMQSSQVVLQGHCSVSWGVMSSLPSGCFSVSAPSFACYCLQQALAEPHRMWGPTLMVPYSLVGSYGEAVNRWLKHLKFHMSKKKILHVRWW
jgi:hypothetical protein